jgi:hypothetical protein
VTGRQRIIYLAVAALIAVAAVVVITAGGDDEPARTAAPTDTPTPTVPAEAEPRATETPTPTPTPRPRPPVLTAANPRTLTFTEGETIRFRVRSDTAEEVHVHGYDRTRAVPAGDTVTISFPATITGVFEVEFHVSGAPLGRLRVEPR